MSEMRTCLVLLFFSFVFPTFVEAEKPIARTPLGIVEGYWTTTVNDRKYAAFDGIPYAVPPISQYRFEEPKPAEAWKGVWKADIEHRCLQYYHYTDSKEEVVIGNEDCLYLNVYTPQVNEIKKYDVIIFIHGGAFMFNSASVYGHKYILDRDVVFVSINYRLGPLGFLSTNDQVLPGNNGLKDQLMALKWVNQNIKYFGGNPNSVTLTGMSAGAASVQIHYLSPLSEGLFHRGIAQSGTALNNWVLTENSREKAGRLGSLVGCNFQESRTLLECLKSRPAGQIVKTVKHFQEWLYNPFSPFGVVIDKFSSNPIVPDHPYMLLKNGQFKHLPLIVSCVEGEGLYAAADFLREPEYLVDIDQKWNKLIPHILDYNYTVPLDETDNVSIKIRRKYLGEESLNIKTYPRLVKMITDRLFIADIELAAKLQSSNTNSSIYFYYFTYRGAHSKSEIRAKSSENFGASHGDDTVYVLSSNVNTRTTPSDVKMTEMLLDIWIEYAKTNIPKFIKFENWLPMDKKYESPISYMHIASSEDVKMETAESLGNRSFWSSMGFLENENLFKKLL